LGGEHDSVTTKDAENKTGNRRGKSHRDGLDERIAAATAAVEQARAALDQLHDAGEQGVDATGQASRHTGALTLGDVLDGTLNFVRRHPGAGVLAAGLIGFLFGRSTKR
jgi:hypothetical protein